MARRGIFISYQHHDRNRAKGFNLMNHSPYVNVKFRGRHLLDPVNSENSDYIRRCVRDQLKGSSVTVVLLGEKTHQSKWVKWEIEESLKRRNGVVAIRLKDQDAPLPKGSEVGELLDLCGAEVLDWDPHGLDGAIERAYKASGRATSVAARASRSSASGGEAGGGGAQGCNR